MRISAISLHEIATLCGNVRFLCEEVGGEQGEQGVSKVEFPTFDIGFASFSTLVSR